MPVLVRVLMVEDVADDAALIERELRRAGIAGATRRVDSERGYREALRTFAPDIVLSDHSLPQFGASDALRIALLEVPDTPVIIVTGSLDEETAAEYIKAGAADYVVKHHLERLGPAVLRALDLRRARTDQACSALRRPSWWAGPDSSASIPTTSRASRPRCSTSSRVQARRRRWSSAGATRTDPGATSTPSRSIG